MDVQQLVEPLIAFVLIPTCLCLSIPFWIVGYFLYDAYEANNRS